MKFTDPEVQAVYLTLVELHDATLKEEETDFVKGKRIAYATALQLLMNNCMYTLSKKEAYEIYLRGSRD